MLNFYQFFNKINGEPYVDIQPPVKYDFQDYGNNLTNSPINGIEGGTHELRPLTDEDMGRYAADDVINHYYQMHQGKNPLRLGDPMSDDQFKKFCGMGW